jgi:Ca-activated chloride channel family protein
MQLPAPDDELDVQALTQIARETGGRFFRAADGQQLSAAYRTIDALEPLARGEALLRPDHEWYPWPLAFALLLGCTLLPWRAWVPRKVVAT